MNCGPFHHSSLLTPHFPNPQSLATNPQSPVTSHESPHDSWNENIYDKKSFSPLYKWRAKAYTTINFNFWIKTRNGSKWIGFLSESCRMVKGSRGSSRSRPEVLYLKIVGYGVWHRYKAAEYSARWYRVEGLRPGCFLAIRAFFV